MNHVKIETILNKQELTKVDWGRIKELCKKINTNFSFVRSKEEIVKFIESEKVFSRRRNYLFTIYQFFCNQKYLFTDNNKTCRLQGYYCSDWGRKSKSISYNYDTSTFKSTDILEFDFIPFAFSNGDDPVFINNNINIKDLFKTNKHENLKEIDFRDRFLMSLIQANYFINYDVEVILHNKSKLVCVPIR